MLLACGLALLAGRSAAAQSQGLVVRDGSLGKEGPLEVGPGVDPLGQDATYLISPELGEQHGSNLFHSFARFSIGQGETATFTGPDPIDGPQSVSNVISRVTGADPSEIDGTLRSTIPGADLWLLNPSGVVFGEGAQLDVPGSFHASTGDYVGFGEGDLERFYADPSRESVLSTARPAAFGLLGEGPAAAISLTGATLDVPEGETISLVGGEVVLDAATLTAEDGGHRRAGRDLTQAWSCLSSWTPSDSGEKGSTMPRSKPDDSGEGGARRLRREVRTLRRSGRSWQEPRPGSRGRPERSRPDLRVRERSQGPASSGHHVPSAGGPRAARRGDRSGSGSGRRGRAAGAGDRLGLEGGQPSTEPGNSTLPGRTAACGIRTSPRHGAPGRARNACGCA